MLQPSFANVAATQADASKSLDSDAHGVRMFAPPDAPEPALLKRPKGVLIKAEHRGWIAEAVKVLAALPDPPQFDVDPQNLL